MQSSSPLVSRALHVRLLVFVQLTVDEVRAEAPNLIKADDGLRMINAAGNGNELMCRASLAQLFEALQAIVYDGLVARFR